MEAHVGDPLEIVSLKNSGDDSFVNPFRSDLPCYPRESQPRSHDNFQDQCAMPGYVRDAIRFFRLSLWKIQTS